MYNSTMFEVSSCKWAIEEHNRNSPPGQSARNKFVDWAKWRKRFGIRKSQKEQDREELMDEVDYVKCQKERNVSSPIAGKKRKSIIDDPKTDTEGDGAERKAWITLNKQRLRETERFEEGGVDEGSKSTKSMKADEMLKMKQLAANNVSQWSSGFLAMKAASSTDRPDCNTEIIQEDTKKRKASIAILAPKEFTKQTKLMRPLEANLEKALDAMKAAIHDHDIIPSDFKVTREILSFREGCDIYVSAFTFFTTHTLVPLPSSGPLVRSAPSTPASVATSTASPMTPGITESPSSSVMRLSPRTEFSDKGEEHLSAASNSKDRVNSEQEDDPHKVEKVEEISPEIQAESCKIVKDLFKKPIDSPRLNATKVIEEASRSAHSCFGHSFIEDEYAHVDKKDLLRRCKNISSRLVEIMKKMPPKHRIICSYENVYSLFELKIHISFIPEMKSIREMEETLKIIDLGRTVFETYIMAMKDSAKELKKSVANAKILLERLKANQADSEVARQTSVLRQQSAAAAKLVKESEAALPKLFQLTISDAFSQCHEYTESEQININ